MPSRAARRRPTRRLATLACAMTAAALVLAATPSRAADLTVTVTGLRSAKGTVHMALYNSAKTFPKSDGMLADKVVPAAEPVATFGNLAAGAYAVAVYHDENTNGHFDQGFLGIPLEGYGFSNGAHAFLGAPEFADAAFPVGDTGTSITIEMTYW